MGMPITIEIDEPRASAAIDRAFAYFDHVDRKFSTYKSESEIMRINRGDVPIAEASAEMREIFRLAEDTKLETGGYFDIVNRQGIFDPSGIVKGWAIRHAARILEQAGFTDFYVEAGGDIQIHGLKTTDGVRRPWKVGIKDPFDQDKVVKIAYLGHNEGMATSGTYIRGQHIYNPKDKAATIDGVVSLTVIGPDVYEADRFATAAFAMGKAGIHFIEKQPGLEGYAIYPDRTATMTTGFERYTKP